VRSMLDAANLDASVGVVPLYGDLSADVQDAAIQPSRPGRRKVVLATSIAQTSLTIEGVRVVIDAGLSRVPRFSPRTGMARLVTVRVSRATAEQRRGRAGRVAPGICYRLWPERLDSTLRPYDAPEMLETDLAPLVLELAAAGIADPAELRWLDPPPPAGLAQGRELLGSLGALSAEGRITGHGRRMAGLGLHPRLAHMLLRGAELGLARVASELAALLADRDPLRASGGDADLRTRIEAIRRGDARIPAAVLQRLRAEATLLCASVRAEQTAEQGDLSEVGMLLSLAYPDRVGQRRSGTAQRFVLQNGQGAYFADPQELGEAPYIVAAELDGDARESRIFLAAPLTLDDVQAHYGDQTVAEDVVEWDAAADMVTARRRLRLGALVLGDAPLRDPDPAALVDALLSWLCRAGLEVLPWTASAATLRARLAFLHQQDNGWPDVSDRELLARLGEWLGPALTGVRRRSDLKRLDLEAPLLTLLDGAQRRQLDLLAPTHIAVPSGSRIAIDYRDASAPALPVRLQEVFGWEETPRIAGGRVPLTLHLLSPAQRPVQVTRDLAGFWRGAYFDVRKNLKWRYPKHYWPDDPLTAIATRRVRPRG
jgi:ATP-dependent helicase HrpB